MKVIGCICHVVQHDTSIKKIKMLSLVIHGEYSDIAEEYITRVSGLCLMLFLQ